MSATDDIAEVKLAGYFIEWDAIEDAKAKLAERSKDLGKAMKDEGFNTKAARTSFREQRADLNATQDDIAKAEEEEKVIDLYRAALKKCLASRAHPAPAHEKTLRNSGSKATSYAEAKGVDRDARAKQRMSESMDDHKALSAELAAAGLISEEACAETAAIADAIARKFGNGPIETNSPETAHGTNPSDGSVNPHGEPVAVAANMENDHVDSSAERASSAVEFGATNSPETATVSVQSHDEAVVSAPTESASDEISATNSIQAGPHLSGVPGGERSTPSIDEGGAKMGEVPASPDRSDEQSGIHHAQSKQAAPNSDDVPAFLKSKEGCLRPGDCKTHFTSVLCSGCANERAKRLVRA